MLPLRSVMATVLLGLVMAMTQAPAQAKQVPVDKPNASPYSPMASEQFSLTGNLGQVPSGPVNLQRLDGSTWRTIASQAPGDGTYTFANQRISASSQFRVAARAADPQDVLVSAVRWVPVARQYVSASIERVCNEAHDCNNTARVVGQVSPPRGPRIAVLQYRSGSSWKSLSVKAATDETTGKFETGPFSIAGWSQWSAKTFRVAVGRYKGSAYGVSAPITFMPGPTHLGDNVLRVDVNGGGYPAKKGVDYTGTATLIQANERKVDRAPLDKFGVRGSTTAGYPKKPYNLRFEDAPADGKVFGMGGDRRWTLLAMYADQSYVRDKTALDLGRKLGGMSWNPDSRYVELFLNSQYMGAYLMTEKVDVDGDRVDVGKNTGMIMEVDMDTVSDYRKGFKSARGGLVFAFKEPDGLGAPDGITPAKLSAIKNKVAKVESYLYSSYRSRWKQQLDWESAVQFHLAVEFFKDIDSDFWRSKYFTWDTVKSACGSELCDGRLHFGPLWDFDKSAGNVDASNPGTAFTRSYKGWQANGTGVGKSNRITFHTHWFAQLWKDSSWRSHLRYGWNNQKLRVQFYRAAQYEVDKNKALIGWGAANDRKRWAGYSKLYKPKGSTYAHEVQYVKSWLKNRFVWMDSQL